MLGEAPVVDTSSATSGVSVSSETFDRLPLARDFYAVAQIATGAARDASGTSFYGSTGAENQYVIEGLNTTGGRLGTEGKTLNFDFIQEVEVKTGGLPAEYGRLTGGLINAITKSGGNTFEGNVFAFYESQERQLDRRQDPARPRPRSASSTPSTTTASRWAAPSSRTVSGSSAPTTGRSAPTAPTSSARSQPSPASRRRPAPAARSTPTPRPTSTPPS